MVRDQGRPAEPSEHAPSGECSSPENYDDHVLMMTASMKVRKTLFRSCVYTAQFSNKCTAQPLQLHCAPFCFAFQKQATQILTEWNHFLSSPCMHLNAESVSDFALFIL